MSRDESAPATRQYLRIQPATDSLDPETVHLQCRRLHALADGERTGLTDLLDSTDPPTIEGCLHSDGDRIEYLVGIDAAGQATGLNPLDRLCHTLFPDTYAIDRVERAPATLDPTTATDAAPVALVCEGAPDRRQDWQTRLTRFERFYTEDQARIPLAAVAETMAAAETPMVYQVLLQPKPDWTAAADARRADIEAGQDTLGQQVLTTLFGLDAPTANADPTRPGSGAANALPASDRSRLDAIAAAEPARSFVVNARLVAAGTDAGTDTGAPPAPDHALRECATAFSACSGPHYTLTTRRVRGDDAAAVATAVRERRVHPPRYAALRTRLPGTPLRSQGLVVDAAALGSLWLLDGAACPAASRRALDVLPADRAPQPKPPTTRLDAYEPPGLTLGRPLDQDGTAADEPIALPLSLQPLHTAWLGRTGSGKSTALVRAIRDNHAATDGADLLIDPKGDGMATDYLRAHYAAYGHLDNVRYFDCSEVLPAISFFDVRPDVEAGVPRATAVDDIVDHYIEILTALMGRERFEQAVRAPDIIRYLVRAQFDPVHGADAFTHRELHGAARRMHERQSAPSVSDPDLERMLGGVVANRARTFDEVMQGVANRLEKIPADRRLARLFDHVPDAIRTAPDAVGPTADAETSAASGDDRGGDDDGDGDAHFDLGHYLDEDVVIVLDLGGLRVETRRAITLVLLSNLWTALRRRRRRRAADQLPLVNCYLEEAASVAATDLVTTLLAQGRGFDCALTLAMQFPGQLDQADPTGAATDEVLNNVGTVLTGPIGVDPDLAERFATDDHPAEAVANRLRGLRRGQWLASLPAGFDTPAPRPFRLQSARPPAGHPAAETGPRAAEAGADQVADAIAAVRARTRSQAGVPLTDPEPTTETDAESATDPDRRVDSALPHTMRLPAWVEYDGALHALRCDTCDNRYDPSPAGMQRAIACCHDPEAVNRDDIPICDLNLKLTPAERADSDWSDAQLMFLQAVYNAQQRRYEPPGYDLLRDSMLRLQEYVGIDREAVDELLASDLLRHDTDHPHRLYSVSPAGRDVIGEHYRQGVDYGHGEGDLEESSQHVFAVEVGRRYLTQAFVDDPDSPVVEVVPYYDLDDNHRLDIAGLDDEGAIRVAVEVERINNDIHEAVPSDFDKIAACDVDEAIWIVMTQRAGHEVLSALNDPADGEPRVEKTYAETTPPQQFRLETPGLTAMYPVEWVRSRLEA
ncbi:ATP-binding protein [Haloplanus pelagicus]|uniref:ATP-binding protein n=1 Tax=Haloplanus pelagicus TaxID=2949995 RepID=UPI00203D194D|nr:ATP-binding protein [Haloplanus sp. HW8-1]